MFTQSFNISDLHGNSYPKAVARIASLSLDCSSNYHYAVVKNENGEPTPNEQEHNHAALRFSVHYWKDQKTYEANKLPMLYLFDEQSMPEMHLSLSPEQAVEFNELSEQDAKLNKLQEFAFAEFEKRLQEAE